MALIDKEAALANMDYYISAKKLIEDILEARGIEIETVPKLIRLIKAQPKVCGRVINVDSFAEAIENLDWYSLHNGKMIQGAEGEETAYYRASDIYTEINKAVTIIAEGEQ